VCIICWSEVGFSNTDETHESLPEYRDLNFIYYISSNNHAHEFQHDYYLGYWHQRADERHGNPSQGYQELLMVRDKVERPPGELAKWPLKQKERALFVLTAILQVNLG